MPEAYNPERRYFRLKGLHGKQKKRFRQAARRRVKQETNAKHALAEQQTSGGLVK